MSEASEPEGAPSPARVKWLRRLAGAISGGVSGDEWERRVMLFASLLHADGVPDEALTQRALAHVARACPYWPSYARLRELLDEWAREAVPRLAAPTEFEARQAARAAEAAARAAREAELAAEWGDAARVRAEVERLAAMPAHGLNAVLARVLRTTVERYAPQHLPLLAPLETPADTARAG